MLEKYNLEQETKDLILDICEVMHSRGYKEISIGAIMRLMGIPDAKALDYDAEYIAIPENFDELVGAYRDMDGFDDELDSESESAPTVH